MKPKTVGGLTVSIWESLSVPGEQCPAVPYPVVVEVPGREALYSLPELRKLIKALRKAEKVIVRASAPAALLPEVDPFAVGGRVRDISACQMGHGTIVQRPGEFGELGVRWDDFPGYIDAPHCPDRHSVSCSSVESVDYP